MNKVIDNDHRKARTRIRSLVGWSAFALVLAALAVPTASSSSTIPSGTKLWAERYNGPGSGPDYGAGVAATADGTEVFVTSQSYGGPATGNDYLTIGYDAATGQRLWRSRYNGAGSGGDQAFAIAVSADARTVFVTGESYGSAATGSDYATVAYDSSTGAQLWATRYDGPGHGHDRAYAVAVSGDGSKLFVTGQSYGGTETGDDYATVAYDASTGAQLWAKRYAPGAGLDAARSLAVSGDGTKLVVAGHSVGSSTYSDYATVAYDASTGARLWAQRYDGPGHGNDDAFNIAAGPTGTKVFVTGYSYGGTTTGNDYATVAYDLSTGAKLWASRYNGGASRNDSAYGLATGGDGTRVFVTGVVDTGTAADDDYVTVAYDSSTGMKLWSNRYNGPADDTDGAYAIGVDKQATRVFVTGESYGGSTTDYDAATVAYDASTGSQLWASRYNAPASLYDGFFALAVAGDGTKVAVAGYSDGGPSAGYDMITAGYEG